MNTNPNDDTSGNEKLSKHSLDEILSSYGNVARSHRDEGPLPPLRRHNGGDRRQSQGRTFSHRMAYTSSLAACLVVGWFVGVKGLVNPTDAIEHVVTDTLYVKVHDTVFIGSSPATASPAAKMIRSKMGTLDVVSDSSPAVRIDSHSYRLGRSEGITLADQPFTGFQKKLSEED